MQAQLLIRVSVMLLGPDLLHLLGTEGIRRSVNSPELWACLQGQLAALWLNSRPMSCRASMMNLVRDLKAATDAGLSPSQLLAAAVATEGVLPDLSCGSQSAVQARAASAVG